MTEQKMPAEVSDEALDAAEGGALNVAGAPSKVSGERKRTVPTTNENIWVCDTMER
ncbi:MAG: hypothetical protein AAGD13_18705 [Pseudomonadota bacterium]